jgi:hypothetical protein
MKVERFTVAAQTATGGGATVFSPPVTGRLASIIYTKDADNAFASTADFTVTVEETGEAVWAESNVNASKTVDPVRLAASTSGVAVSGVYGGIHVHNDRVKIVVAQGGNTRVGTFHVVVA